MLIKVNTSLAGATFSFNAGAIVDSEEFSALVGNGWESLCDPVVEKASDEAKFETADLLPATENTDNSPFRRGRRK